MEEQTKQVVDTGVVSDPGRSAFVENMQRMQEIVWHLKENPDVGPVTEKPKDVNALTKVELPEDGGVFTYMENMEYPFQGFPYYEFVDSIDSMKKITRGVISELYHQLKRKKWYHFLSLLPSLWVTKDVVRAGVAVFHRAINRFKIKPLRYCISVRELYRAFTYERVG